MGTVKYVIIVKFINENKYHIGVDLCTLTSITMESIDTRIIDIENKQYKIKFQQWILLQVPIRNILREL